jgi:hypothetical protein
MTKEEEALLATLHSALDNARAKENYTVPAGTARILADRVADLQGVAPRVYAELMDEKVSILAKSKDEMNGTVHNNNLVMYE